VDYQNMPRRRGDEMKYLLLLAPCVLAVLTPLYNGVDPALFGIPLFYWFQMLLIPVSALAIYAADRFAKAQRS
jgi:Protein of unknown function (DUF3311)